MVGWSTIKTNKNVSNMIPATVAGCEARHQVTLILKASNESGWTQMDVFFSVAFFLHPRISSILSQNLKFYNSVKWIILLPVRCNKTVVCSHCFISQYGYHIALILHIILHSLHSASLLLSGIHSRLLRTAQNWMWELLFVFIGRKTKFKYVAILPKNRYTDSCHRPIQPIVLSPAMDT